MNEVVKESEGKNFAKEFGCIFQLVSPKFGTGIDELFNKIAEKIINPEGDPRKYKDRNILKSKLEKFFSF